MSEIESNIGILYQRRSWFSRKKQFQALERLSQLATPYQVKYFFSVVFSLKGRLSKETAKTVSSIMLKVKPSEWTHLYPSFQYLNLNHLHVKYLSLFPDPVAAELLGIASLNGVGRIREAAVVQLQQIRSERRIPYILLRLNDWVEPVRRAAINALQRIIKEEPAAAFLPYTYIFDWMSRVERTDLSAIRNQIADLLVAGCPKELLEGLDSRHKHVRLFCYDALTRKEPDLLVLKKGLCDRSLAIRQKAFACLKQSPVVIQKQHMSVVFGDPCPGIQCQAMMLIAENQWREFDELMRQNLLSRFASVRMTARYVLKKQGMTTFAHEYRRQISGGVITAGIISGLSETGDQEDVDTILPFVSDLRPKIRAAALAGVYRLDNKRAVNYLIEALKDPSAKVRRVCIILLCRNRSYEDSDVRKVLECENRDSRIAALYLLTGAAKWESLIDILNTINDKDEKVRCYAWSALVRWYQKRSANNWVNPGTSILERIETMYRQISSMQSDIPVEAVRFWNDLPLLIDSGKKIWKES